MRLNKFRENYALRLRILYKCNYFNLLHFHIVPFSMNTLNLNLEMVTCLSIENSCFDVDKG